MKRLIIFFLLFSTLSATEKPPHISQEVWEEVKPYLLPDNHPAKPALDTIFSRSRATFSDKTMKKAGFDHFVPRKYTHLVVTRHPELPGYVIKTYLDAQRSFHKRPEYFYWQLRIQGRNLIEQYVKAHHLQHLFKTPKKWIYTLPEYPAPPKDFIRKNFILVEEDMQILDSKSNNEAWKSPLVDIPFLNEFFALITELGLNDCAKPDNAPFSIDGRVAFIDTQSYYRWPVRYKGMKEHLSPEMKQHWKKLTKGRT